MNARIKLLAEQACAFADIQYNKQTRATFYTNKSVEEFFREKFAELIVRECAGIVQPYMSRWEEDCDLVIKIKEHFGVEE